MLWSLQIPTRTAHGWSSAASSIRSHLQPTALSDPSRSTGTSEVPFRGCIKGTTGNRSRWSSDASGHFVWLLSRIHYPKFDRLRQLPPWCRVCINFWPFLTGSPSSFSRKGCPFLHVSSPVLSRGSACANILINEKDVVAHRLRCHVRYYNRRASFVPVYSTLSCHSIL